MKTDLVRVARDCHVPTGQVDELAGLCVAVLDSSAPDSVIASLTAARLHGFWLPPNASTALHVATAVPGMPGRAMTAPGVPSSCRIGSSCERRTSPR